MQPAIQVTASVSSRTAVTASSPLTPVLSKRKLAALVLGLVAGDRRIADLVSGRRPGRSARPLKVVRRVDRYRPFRPSRFKNDSWAGPNLHRVTRFMSEMCPLRPFLNGQFGSESVHDLQNASFRRRISPNTSASLAPLIPSPDLISAMPARRNGLVASSSDNSDGTVGSPLERASAIRAMRS